MIENIDGEVIFRGQSGSDNCLGVEDTEDGGAYLSAYAPLTARTVVVRLDRDRVRFLANLLLRIADHDERQERDDARAPLTDDEAAAFALSERYQRTEG